MASGHAGQHVHRTSCNFILLLAPPLFLEELADAYGDPEVMSCPVTEMDEGGQEPADEHQPVLRAAPTACFRGREASLAW